MYNFLHRRSQLREYILLLPIIFIIHDMEEIVGFKSFYEKNAWLYERYPRITAPYRDLKTERFALAVYEEFIPFFGLSLLAYYFPNQILYVIWMGLFVALTAHFVVHIGQSILIRKYSPSLITSIVFLPVSILILYKSAAFIDFTPLTILCIIAVIPLMMLNLIIAHKLMQKT